MIDYLFIILVESDPKVLVLKGLSEKLFMAYCGTILKVSSLILIFLFETLPAPALPKIKTATCNLDGDNRMMDS